jgi:hypothetical protein
MSTAALPEHIEKSTQDPQLFPGGSLPPARRGCGLHARAIHLPRRAGQGDCDPSSSAGSRAAAAAWKTCERLNLSPQDRKARRWALKASRLRTHVEAKP